MQLFKKLNRTRHGVVDMGQLVMGFVAVFIAAILVPIAMNEIQSIDNNQTTEAFESNLSGGSVTLLQNIDVFFAIALIVGAVALAVPGIRKRLSSL